MGFFKNILNKTSYGKGVNQALGRLEIDKDWADIMMYDPENENKIYDTGKAYEKNFFPNGLENSPLEKPDGYDIEKEDTPSPDKSSLTAPNKYMELFNKNHRAETDILLKPLHNTNEDEINAARKFAMFENKDEVLRQRLNKRMYLAENDYDKLEKAFINKLYAKSFIN